MVGTFSEVGPAMERLPLCAPARLSEMYDRLGELHLAKMSLHLLPLHIHDNSPDRSGDNQQRQTLQVQILTSAASRPSVRPAKRSNSRSNSNGAAM